MRQSDPPRQIIRHSQNITQRINLKLIKRLIHRSLEQSFQLVHAVLNLVPGLGVLDLAIAVRVRNRQRVSSVGGLRILVAESEGGWRDGEEAIFDGF